MSRAAYFERLDLLETDATFYDPPRDVALRRWRAEAPGGSAFSVMAWQLSLKSSVYPLHLGTLTIPCYAALLALVLNIAVAAVVTLAMNALSPNTTDETAAEDYLS